MADLDVGEMFLNSILHKDLWNLNRVNLMECTDNVDDLD
jgi:hypothetical protein